MCLCGTSFNRENIQWLKNKILYFFRQLTIPWQSDGFTDELTWMFYAIFANTYTLCTMKWWKCYIKFQLKSGINDLLHKWLQSLHQHDFLTKFEYRFVFRNILIDCLLKLENIQRIISKIPIPCKDWNAIQTIYRHELQFTKQRNIYNDNKDSHQKD